MNLTRNPGRQVARTRADRKVVTMQLGKALVGAVIGGAIGIALMVAAYFLFAADQAWLAIVVALCAGLGVRALVATKGHASYARGAMTGILTIAAFVGAKFLIAELASRSAVAGAARAERAAAAVIDNADDKSGDSDDESGEIDELASREIGRPLDFGGTDDGVVRAPQGFSTWDFVWLCVAALVAYELGRGSEQPHPVEQATASEPPTEPQPPA